MLGIIDPNYNSLVPARYFNRYFLGNTVFFTSNIPIQNWYLNEDPSQREAFYARINFVYDFERLGEDKIAHYTVKKIKYDVSSGTVTLEEVCKKEVDLKAYFDFSKKEKESKEILSLFDEL